MQKLPSSLINTWLFLAQCDEPQLAKSKLIAFGRIKHYFGNNELAKLYIEQSNDKTIEVFII
ncbi:hypothetical protein [Thalassotalea profundi]|uniref:Uncharacterized protein n=1 Tax=Thalassotalea profundi TaxID=2036687 RepID=A0ABQ3J7L6_9GAMM|nr:hypothetical protein [Thalassotalea profundi]GHF01339.1 hypothetical protein GCM10011501_33540 [Thalassotalea profundi]